MAGTSRRFTAARSGSRPREGSRSTSAPSLLRRRQDVGVERLRRAHPGRLPDLVHDPLARQSDARVGHEQGQQVELLGAQRQLLRRPAMRAAPTGPPAARPPERAAPRSSSRSTAPQVRADPGQQLGEAKRLDQIVVAAGVQPGDDVELVVARRQDQDRQVRARGAQPPADLQAVDVRQAEVEDHEAHGRVGGAHRARPRATAAAPRSRGSRARARALRRSPRRPRLRGSRARPWPGG